jgi:hypothetical protein
MYVLPILDNNGNEQKYSNEFDNIYKAGLQGNLIDAQDPVIDYNTGKQFTIYNTTGGIYNQNKLFENNDDPNEEQQVTNEQAMARIRNMSGINRPLTQTEKSFELYTNDSYDPRFRNELLKESMKSGSNIFSEYSQDHVNNVRESYKNFFNEENLYTRAINPLALLASKQANKGTDDLMKYGFSKFADIIRKEQEEKNKETSKRNEFVKKEFGSTPTMTDKFRKEDVVKDVNPTTPTTPEKPVQKTTYPFVPYAKTSWQYFTGGI